MALVEEGQLANPGEVVEEGAAPDLEASDAETKVFHQLTSHAR